MSMTRNELEEIRDAINFILAEMARPMDRAGKILQRIGNGGQMNYYRDVACPNCGTVYGVGYSDVPHSVENIHRICDTCMMPIEVKNPWNEKDKISL